MTLHIALVRAVNLGSHGKIAMPRLRELAEELGLRSVATLLQSGNLVFQTDERSTPALEGVLEKQSAKRLALRTDFFVRSAKEWASLVAKNPFPSEAKDDPSHLVVMVLKDAPSADAVDALRAAIKGPEVVRAKGRHLYVVYPAGIGRSRLTLAVIEKKLGTRGTGRNWNTVLKLAELATAPPPEPRRHRSPGRAR